MLTIIGVLGLPVTYGLAGLLLSPDEAAGGGFDASAAATAAGAWVWVVALLGLVPLWTARNAQPAQQVNARLLHVVVRLMLTAGGLIVFLLLLPEKDRLGVGLFGLGWYALTWTIDLQLLRPARPRAGA